MKFFCTDSAQFPDHGVKFKAGSIVELTEEAAAVFNQIKKGILEPFDALKHTPAPVVAAPGFEAAPVTETAPEVSKTQADADAQVGVQQEAA